MMMFETGFKLSGARSEYVIQSELGQGLTARVYRAWATAFEKDVALKVLLPGLDKDIVDRFHAEANNLAAVSTAVDRRKAAIGSESIATPPEYYEVHPPSRNQTDGYTFMALEIMEGRKLEWLLMENGPLPEAEALSVGMQLFRLLAVLHEDLRRTYSDFKFENLWLEEDKGQLRVTDWNVLSDERDLKGVTWDLERGSRALVRIMTGHPVQPGRKLSRHPNWDGLSRALQRLLAQMLQADPQRRIQSASEVAAELARLAAYWQGSCGSWLKKARGMIDGSQVDQALDITDVLDARIRQEATQAGVTDMACEHQLDELQQSLAELRPDAVRLVAAGMQLLKGKSLDRARERFEQAIEIAPEEVAAFRGLVVTHAFASGHVQEQDDQKTLLNILQSCEDGRYEEAQSEANLITRAIPKLLGFDIAAHLAWSAAQKVDVGVQTRLNALKKAEQALAELQNEVPGYADAVKAGFEPTLAEVSALLKADLDAEQADRERSNQAASLIRLLQEAADSATLERREQGVARVEEEQANLLIYVPYAQVLEAVMAFGESCLEKNRPVLAMRVFAVGANLRHDLRPDFRLRWQVANAARLRAENADSEVAKQEVEAVRETLGKRLRDLSEREDQEAFKKEIDSLTKLMVALTGRPASAPLEYLRTLLDVVWRDRRQWPEVEKVIADRLGFEGVLGALAQTNEPGALRAEVDRPLREIASKHLGIPALFIEQVTPPPGGARLGTANKTNEEFLAERLTLQVLAGALAKKMAFNPAPAWRNIDDIWRVASLLMDLSKQTLQILQKELRAVLPDADESSTGFDREALERALAEYLKLPDNVALLSRLLEEIRKHEPGEARQIAGRYRPLLEKFGSVGQVRVLGQQSPPSGDVLGVDSLLNSNDWQQWDKFLTNLDRISNEHSSRIKEWRDRIERHRKRMHELFHSGDVRARPAMLATDMKQSGQTHCWDPDGKQWVLVSDLITEWSHRANPAQVSSPVSGVNEAALTLLRPHLDMKDPLAKLKDNLASFVDYRVSGSDIVKSQYHSLDEWPSIEVWLTAVEGQRDLKPDDFGLAERYLEKLSDLVNNKPWRGYATLDTPVFRHAQERLNRVVEREKSQSARTNDDNYFGNP